MITMGNGFMSTGKPSIAMEIAAVPIGLLVLAIGLPILIVVGDPMLDSGIWIRLLVAFDVIFFVISLWIFPIALEE